MQKIAFLDTNVFLHYKDFEQIDFLELTNADSITVIIPPIIISELQIRKDSRGRDKLAKRAGQILKKLNSIFQNNLDAKVKDGISIHLEDRDSPIDFRAYQLNRDIQDDHLIASILMYREEMPGREIVLITADAGLTLRAKAKRFGIKTLQLPDELKLPDEPDPDQERIRELEQENRELKLKSPKLILSFDSGAQNYKFTIRQQSVEIKEREIERRILELKTRYPKLTENDYLDNFSKMYAIFSRSSVNRSFDVAQYNKELDDFFRDYATYLKSEVVLQEFESRTINLKIFISNNGTIPADDIDISMHFPDGFTLSDNNKHLLHSATPEPPKFGADKLFAQLKEVNRNWDYMAPISPKPGPPPNISALHIKRTNSYDAEAHIRYLKHQFTAPLNTLYLTFESIEKAFSFHIDYEIFAANIPKKISGKLDVIIQKDKF